MHLCPGLHALQFLHRPQYPLPHRVAVQVATLKHGICPHGGMDRRVLAVVLHEDVGGAIDVEDVNEKKAPERDQALLWGRT